MLLCRSLSIIREAKSRLQRAKLVACREEIRNVLLTEF